MSNIKFNMLVKIFKINLIFIICLLSLTFTSCMKKSSIKNCYIPPNDTFTRLNTKTIAVLPFKNYTQNKEITKLVQISFYSHLSVRAFRDIELVEVNALLKKLHITTPDINDKNLIKKIAKILGADYLVFGTINSNTKVYAGIYSLNSLEIGIKIIDTKTLKVVWKDTINTKRHEGEIPTSIISLPFISYSTTINLSKDTTYNLIQNVCRLLAYRIPSELIYKNTSNQANNTKNNVNKYLIQAGAFFSKVRAIKFSNKIKSNGLNSFVKSENEFYKVFIGPFSSYNEALKIKKYVEKKFKILTIIKKSNNF